MKTPYSLLFACIMLTVFSACSNSKKENISEEEGTIALLPEANSEVTVTELKRQTFNHELISNGKVSAKGVADLRFQSAEVVAHIWVKNGDRVRKGQKLAELDKFKLSNKLIQTKDALERSKLELQDVLIGQGYNIENQDQVPKEIMQLARVKSGYDQNIALYELAQYEEKNATLIAPFDGTVANLFTKPMNLAPTNTPFCTIIETQGMEVDFTVLENELPLIKNGDKVNVIPYSDNKAVYTGRITEINPVVDDKGMVKVKARVDDKGKLFTGMNVRISVLRSLEDQLVIPKTAVVLRSGKQVVFTLENNKAKWVYVQTGLENSDNYTMADDALKEGDIVIVTGNINLAHESEVNVIQ